MFNLFVFDVLCTMSSGSGVVLILQDATIKGSNCYY